MARSGRRRERLKLEGPSGAQFLEIDLSKGDPAVGKEIKVLKLPPDTVLVSIRRGNRLIIPRGDIAISADDEMLAVTTPAKVKELRQALRKPSESGSKDSPQ